MANYEEARVKLTNTQTGKSKSATKNKNEKTLRITKKNFQDEEFPHELLLTTKQKTKIRNVFANNMLTCIKLTKAQLSKIIQLGEFHGKTLGILGKKLLLDLAVLLDNVLHKLATTETLSVLDKFERKIMGKEL